MFQFTLNQLQETPRSSHIQCHWVTISNNLVSVGVAVCRLKNNEQRGAP